MRRGIALIGVVAALFAGGTSVAAAAPPVVESVGISAGSVTATTASIKAVVNPKGVSTTCLFEYLTEAAYEENLDTSPGGEPFTGAAAVPPSGAEPGSGNASTPVFGTLHNLSPATAYRYRVRLQQLGEPPVFSVVRPFFTQDATNTFELLDHRGWEMVSPVDKGGGAIQPPGAVAGGGVFQAAAAGGSFTYSSGDSFGGGAQGAPAGSQYLSSRGSDGWSTANITTPLLSGSYGSQPDGVPYQIFSGDLGLGLLSNGERCRGGGGSECPVVNPPLPGSDAPSGYRDYYRRTSSGAFESLLTEADLQHTSLGPEQYELRLVAATPDLLHIVLSGCAALTANATEVSAPEGCDPADQNLYEWSAGGLSLLNLLPGEADGTPGARIAASTGAISVGGTRVYFVSGGNLYLREDGMTKTVLEGAESGAFAGASADGSVAYLIAGDTLFRYEATTEALTPITSGGGVEGVLGISSDGAKVYYAKSGAVFLRSGSGVFEVASSALPSNWPAPTGTARITAEGSHLLFLSKGELTGYPSEGKVEAFLYGPSAGGGPEALTCVSCDPSGAAPEGDARIPGSRPNGDGPDATNFYKPRVLSADGNRLFFESPDQLVARDQNKVADVYEWEAAGEGTCASFGGCVQLISGGTDPEPSYFLDADEDGDEAFFLTAASLYSGDPGSYDVYDAREDGGFPTPETPIPCIADACQVLPEAPEDPSPGTLVPNAGNPPLKVTGARQKRKRGHAKRSRHHRKHPKRRAQKKRGQG